MFNVSDHEPPTIENCDDPPIYLTAEKGGTDVSWDEPTVFDNSGNVTVKCCLNHLYTLKKEVGGI